jgi:hypothetical protein
MDNQPAHFIQLSNANLLRDENRNIFIPEFRYDEITVTTEFDSYSELKLLAFV